MSRCCMLVAAVVATSVFPTTATAQFPTRTKGEGTFIAAAPGVITVRSAGRVLQLKIKPDRPNTVSVSGQLAPEQLKNGAIVRIAGKLKGTAFEDEIAEIKVHTVADEYRQELLQEEGEDESTVIGQVYSFRNGTLTLLSNRKRYTAKLAEDAAIVVETRDYRVAKQGDAVAFDGYVGADKTSVNASNIEIKLKSPEAKEGRVASQK